jgi:hypothetical protein
MARRVASVAEWPDVLAHGPLGVCVPTLRWKGDVIRLDDLTDAERIAIGGRARGAYPPSEVQSWLCRSCWTWASNGAYRVGRCNWCHAPRPE